MFSPQAVTLNTKKVTLRPLSPEHLDDFYTAGAFPDIWRWSLPDKCQSKQTARTWLAYSQAMAEKGEHVPFAIFDNASGKLVGSTRYCSIKREDRNIEIGFTFITPKYQRSYINTHTKYCLLKHAFEDLKAIRVEFKTHENNEKSRNAITRLGAKYEGILRHQRILSDGTFRNTAIFSIIDNEWQSVKAKLREKL
jgi:RimJ/RimL family protein N-acetyltransferase